MKFCDLAKTLHKYRSNRSETVAVCVLVLTDAILDDVALDRVGEASKEVNPLYGLSQASLQSIYNGNRPISVDAAATILPRIDEEHFAEFVNSLSFDALSQLSQDMQEYGFDAIPSNVAEICANIMAQIINERASGRAGDIKTLTIKKKEIGKRIKDIAPATIECKDGKLHICGEEIIIHRQLVPDEVADVELRYIKALCDAYADALHRDSVSVEEIPSLPWPYLDSSKAELARIIAQLKGLDSTEADLRGQQEEILRKLTALREKRTCIEELVSQELKPKADELTSAIAQYRAYIQLSREVQLVTEFAKTWNDDLDDLAIADTEEGEKIKYRPKEYFDQEFQTAMSDFADEILRECQYQNLATARFNMTTFDVEVNGEPKGSSHGKGYRSYLNTVVALMFHRYLGEHALYNPHLLIIDTPLHGFDEEDAPDSMKAGLYSYFLRHQEGQLIIIENLDHIPPLDYEAGGANVITFTRKIGEGRYGFLNEVY